MKKGVLITLLMCAVLTQNVQSKIYGVDEILKSKIEMKSRVIERTFTNKQDQSLVNACIDGNLITLDFCCLPPSRNVLVRVSDPENLVLFEKSYEINESTQIDIMLEDIIENEGANIIELFFDDMCIYGYF